MQHLVLWYVVTIPGNGTEHKYLLAIPGGVPGDNTCCC